MKRFLLKTFLFLVVFFSALGGVSRLFIDPVYFAKLNTYNTPVKSLRSIFFSKNETDHVDFLFIGTSRVPATIDAEVFSRQTGKTAIVAGRGYMTPGVHYQALKNKLKESPDYLKNAVVFLEYPGSSTFETPFANDRYWVYESDVDNEAMPHLILPHLDGSYLKEYLKKSQNSFSVKTKLFFLYLSSFYRTAPFIEETLSKLDKPLGKKKNDLVVDEGGIRNDAIDMVNEKARVNTKYLAEKAKSTPVLSNSKIDSSSLAYFHKLITENGGKLCLYRMPLHSIQQSVYNTDKERYNHKVFERWIRSHNIKVINNDKFKYHDKDFPDTWHLSKDRRDEFSTLLLENFNAQI